MHLLKETHKRVSEDGLVIPSDVCFHDHVPVSRAEAGKDSQLLIIIRGRRRRRIMIIIMIIIIITLILI